MWYIAKIEGVDPEVGKAKKLTYYVDAMSFTEAEAKASKIAESQDITDFYVKAISRPRIEAGIGIELASDGREVSYYQVQVDVKGDEKERHVHIIEAHNMEEVEGLVRAHLYEQVMAEIDVTNIKKLKLDYIEK